jgi:hypothetical protein
MPRFRKGHKLGFQLNNVPKNKGVKKPENDFIPPPILRLDEEMKEAVESPPSLSEGVAMISRVDFPKLLRPTMASKGKHATGLTQSEMQR